MKKNKNNIIKPQTITLSRDNCENIGTILCYSFPRLYQYKIKDMNKLIEIKKIILEQGINVEKDYLRYCKENKITDKKITYYWKTQRSKYICLPELIFLITRYSKVSEVKIDINLFNESLNEDESQAQLTELTILNIFWLFNSLKSFKINLINENLQTLLYKYYLKKLNRLLSNSSLQNLKKNSLINKYNIYAQKWNFVDYFKLEEHRNINNQETFFTNLNDSDNSLLRYSTGFTDIHEILNKSRTLSITEIKRNAIANLYGSSSNLHFQNTFHFNKIRNVDNKSKEKKKQNIVKYYHNTIELILLTLFSLHNSENFNNLELIMNESYTTEYLIFFKTILNFDEIDENIHEFNILDLLIYNNKLCHIYKLNIEINTLDFTSFENLLNVIYNNQSLTSINMSFFSSEATYFTQALYKIYREHNDENDLLHNYEKPNYLFEDITDIDEKILNKLSFYFIYNLTYFFDILNNMPNLNELGLNFDIPYIIMNNPNYMNPILKFIINILLFIFNNNSTITKFCLLSPRTVFDSRKIPNIHNLMNNINVNNSLLLKDLSLHFQFYQISDINNFVNTKLEILNIGDLDVYTFKILCDNICSPDFNLNSSLKKLSIGLLNSIIEFNIDIKYLLRKLFSIKIRNLTILNLYTNIIIDEIEYDYLLQILNNNWISEYTLFFNSQSELVMDRITEDIKKLKFFIPHNLEKKLLEPDDIMNLNDNPITLDVDNNKDYYDDSYWYLKYLFEYVYVDKMKNEKRIKNMIMGILKYLYILKTPKINHLSTQVGY